MFSVQDEGDELMHRGTKRGARRTLLLLAALPLSLSAASVPSDLLVTATVTPVTPAWPGSEPAGTNSPALDARVVTPSTALLDESVRAGTVTVASTRPPPAGTVDGHEDVPAVALAAYERAASVLAQVAPACRVSWTLLAAIGRVESDHGRHGGATLGSDGVSTPAIIGPALDGAGPVAAIRDSDGGTWDGDRVWDHAVGPMQFIPQTWAVVGADGDGDGVRSPHDIDDAALSAAVYLCFHESGIDEPARMRAALLHYNHSAEYASLVMAYERGYRQGSPTSVSATASVTPLDAGLGVRAQRPSLLDAQGIPDITRARTWRGLRRAASVSPPRGVTARERRAFPSAWHSPLRPGVSPEGRPEPSPAPPEGGTEQGTEQETDQGTAPDVPGDPTTEPPGDPTIEPPADPPGDPSGDPAAGVGSAGTPDVPPGSTGPGPPEVPTQPTPVQDTTAPPPQEAGDREDPQAPADADADADHSPDVDADVDADAVASPPQATGVWRHCAPGWCLDSLLLDLGPTESLDEAAPADFDGDGVIASRREELTGLVGTSVTVTFRPGHSGWVVRTVNGIAYDTGRSTTQRRR